MAKRSVSKRDDLVSVTILPETDAKREPTEIVAVAARIAPVPVVTELAIASIRLDGGTQSRASLSTQTIAEYAEAMTAGATFPPVVVFDDGKARWLADGFHRVNASVKLGRERIACEVREGSQRDAILYSVAANATHGLRRSNADKRHAVELLVGDSKWSKKSDRWIADTCGVSHTFISKARDQLATVASSSAREGKDGKARKLPASKPTSVAVAPAAAAAVALDVNTCTDEEWALNEIAKGLDHIEALWMPGVGCDRYIAALKASEQRARDHFGAKEVANG